MSTDLNSSFNEQYMSINTKLKKRFMRKPNISEATNEFIALAIQCEHSEQPAFAGHAYVGAAKCEASAGNFLGEAEHYLAAARQFMKAEKKLRALKFYSPDRENLEAAIGCYMQALNKYPEKSSVRTCILMELGDELVKFNHKLEALAYYEQALQTVDDETVKFVYMKNLLNLQIDCGKYGVALDTANTICDTNTNIPEDILVEVQINRILLALIEHPSEENRPESLNNLFNDLMKGNDNNSIPFNTDLRLKLQSVIMCCSIADMPTLLRVSADVKKFLTRQQHHLLDTINTKPLMNMIDFSF